MVLGLFSNRKRQRLREQPAPDTWVRIISRNFPLFNRLSVVNTATGARQIVLQAQTPEQAAVVAEFMRRGVTGEPRMGLFTPGIWAPFPGLMTGIIVSSSGPVYGTTLGNALVKLPR